MLSTTANRMFTQPSPQARVRGATGIQSPLRFGILTPEAREAARITQSKATNAKPLSEAQLAVLQAEFPPEKVEYFRKRIDPATGFSVDPGSELVSIDTALFDEAFDRNHKTYISRGGGENPIGERYPRFIDFLRTGPYIKASIVSLSEEPDPLTGKPVLVGGFTDGRHRYAVFRDLGMSPIPVMLNPRSLGLARKYGLIRKP